MCNYVWLEWVDRCVEMVDGDMGTASKNYYDSWFLIHLYSALPSEAANVLKVLYGKSFRLGKATGNFKGNILVLQPKQYDGMGYVFWLLSVYINMLTFACTLLTQTDLDTS